MHFKFTKTVNRHFHKPCSDTESPTRRVVLIQKQNVSSLMRRSLVRVRGSSISPTDILRLMMQPNGRTRMAVRSADYMEQAITLIQERSTRVKHFLNATGRSPLTRAHTCSHTLKHGALVPGVKQYLRKICWIR